VPLEGLIRCWIKKQLHAPKHARPLAEYLSTRSGQVNALYMGTIFFSAQSAAYRKPSVGLKQHLGPHTEIGNDISRENLYIWENFGNTDNFKPWLISDMDLSDLDSPRWSTKESVSILWDPSKRNPGLGKT